MNVKDYVLPDKSNVDVSPSSASLVENDGSSTKRTILLCFKFHTYICTFKIFI